MSNTSIKTHYHDALFFASAFQNKDTAFYLKPSQYKVLLKLIHYSSTYDDITFQNKDIAKHIFLDETTTKDSVEALIKKGYIRTELDRFNNRLGFKSKRTIYINWSFIQSILDKITEQVSEELPTQEPLSDNDISVLDSIDILKEYLNDNAGEMRIIKKTLIYNDIENGKIRTIAELQHELN